MASDNLRIPKYLVLYNGVPAKKINLKEITDYIASYIKPIRIITRTEIISYRLKHLNTKTQERCAREIAQAKVLDPNRETNERELLNGEIKFEGKWLLKQSEKPLGILYDATKLQRLYFDCLPPKEQNLDYLPIIMINQLFGTWDKSNCRYHLRTSLCGFPNIISIPGIVEAPARPREFYLKKQLGIDPIKLNNEFRDRFVDYDDPRLTELVKGYVMQAIFYHITGDPFCRDNDCRLFNAHWQEELIRAQAGVNTGLCRVHEKILGNL